MWGPEDKDPSDWREFNLSVGIGGAIPEVAFDAGGGGGGSGGWI